MRSFDVAELIESIDEILRLAEVDGKTIEITDRGRVIAHLVPVRALRSETMAAKGDVGSDLEYLSAEISANWPSDVSAVDAVHDVRREF